MRIFRELTGRIRDMYLLEQLDSPGGFGGFSQRHCGARRLEADYR